MTTNNFSANDFSLNVSTCSHRISHIRANDSLALNASQSSVSAVDWVRVFLARSRLLRLFQDISFQNLSRAFEENSYVPLCSCEGPWCPSDC